MRENNDNLMEKHKVSIEAHQISGDSQGVSFEIEYNFH